ncbi:MAG: LLM class F420-dependent oxidoreductase [Solirubrobacteraceae bacterium]
MKLGLMIFPTLGTPDPATLGRMAEERGYESLWFPEHTHIPASRESPYPAGGELPPEYSRTYDPFVALTAAAAATTTLKIGTGICLVVERDPIVTAKEVASLDHLSGGRFLFGVGLGWNREEMANHGTDPRTRRGLMAERVEAMKAIWTQDEASYHGEHVNFDRIWSWPKPLQQPHPPVVVGGNGPTVLDRVLRFGDAWMPNVIDDDTLLAQMAELRERADRDIPVYLYGAPRDAERLERYADAGVERAIFYLSQRDRAGLDERLDRDRALLDAFA